MVIFENESLDYLIRLNEHCIKKGYEEYLGYKEKPKNPNKKKDYKISIIIPNYNNSKWLDKCLGSITSQSYKNYEIIFVDDLSTDNSIEVASKYNCKIVALKQKRLNGGARNEGYLHVTGDYIYYVDSDDWLVDTGVLSKINDNLTGQDVLFVGVGTTENEYYIPNYKDIYEAIKGWSGCYGMVVKKELATKQECLFPEGTLKEDRTQHYRVCLNMKTWSCLKDIVYIWNRRNSKSVTTIRNNKWKIDTIRNWAEALELYETYKGKDIKMDEILFSRVADTELEVKMGGDSQK